jgi:hypothetical protein
MGLQDDARRPFDEQRREAQEAKDRFVSAARRSPLIDERLQEWCRQMGVTTVPEFTVRESSYARETVHTPQGCSFMLDFSIDGLRFNGQAHFHGLDICRLKVSRRYEDGRLGPEVSSLAALSFALHGDPGQGLDPTPPES